MKRATGRNRLGITSFDEADEMSTRHHSLVTMKSKIREFGEHPYGKIPSRAPIGEGVTTMYGLSF